ncbi:lysophospholipid acyltransferase family protein [Haliea sp. E17]|uniref:lysophospholipid acyltransferase family protein n=1 Tax=Haliea sp. E17 TaxID=3401576 RepID=UPI003AAF075A
MNGIKAGLVKLILRLSALLPLRWVRALGRAAGRVAWWLNSGGRRVTQRNIDLAFPEKTPDQRRELARRSLQSTAELALEMGHVWLRSWNYVDGLIESVEGAELVTQALAAGRGVVVLGPHIGNWEVLGLHLATLGPAVSLYEPPHLAGLDGIVRAARERSGATLVPTDSRGLATLLRCIKRGHIAGILPDQVPRHVNAGENVAFMGVRCFTPTLASQMIRRSGAVALFAMALRSSRGFRIVYFPADDAIYADDILQSLSALNRGVETCVRAAEDQYQWEYKRFKVRPKEGPGAYHDL